MGKELTGFEQFLQLVKEEHERQNKEADDLEKRLSTIEENLEKLKNMIEKTTTKRVTKAVQELEKSKKEFPKTFQEVLDILRTASKSGRADSLYVLWNRISPFNINQGVFNDIKRELTVIKCMLITKAINIVDDSGCSSVHHLRFELVDGDIYDYNVDYGFSLFAPSTLTFKSKEGADHALKYFKEDWKRMFAGSK